MDEAGMEDGWMNRNTLSSKHTPQWGSQEYFQSSRKCFLKDVVCFLQLAGHFVESVQLCDFSFVLLKPPESPIKVEVAEPVLSHFFSSSYEYNLSS